MLDKSNYQTAVLRKAIENLTAYQIGKRTQIKEFDVRDELDKVRKETQVCLGWKQDPTDPSKNLPIIKSASDIWQYSESHIQTVLAEVRSAYNLDKTKYKFETKELTKEAFCEIIDSLKNWAPMVKAEDVPNFVQSLLYTAHYAQTMDKNDVPQQVNILFSPVQGGGKSDFLKELQRSADEVGVYNDWSSFPERNDTNANVEPFIQNAVTFIDDIQVEPDKVLSMAIGRKGNTEVKVKYGKPYNAEFNSEVWGATNNFLKWDRTRNIINCNSYNVKALRNNFEKLFEKYLKRKSGITLCNIWNYQFSQKFQISKIKKEDDTNISIEKLGLENRLEKSLKKVGSVQLLLNTFIELKDAPIDWSNVSCANIVKYMDIPRDKQNSMKGKLARILKGIASEGIPIVLKTRGSVEYEKWDLTVIKDIKAEDIFSEKIEEDSLNHNAIFDELERTMKAYDELKERVDEFFPQEERFLKGSDEKLDDSWTICTKYDKEGEYNANGDQVCVNKPLEGETKNRTNAKVRKQNFLFECDDIPVKQQVEQIENAPQELKDSLLWTCFTGGKSIHAVVHTNLSDEEGTPECRKYIHQKLSEKYFGGHADKSGQNASRLARAPNAIRQDEKHPGAKQLCLQFNMDAKPLDVSGLVEDYKEDERLRRSLKELTGRSPIPEECRRESSIHTLEDLEKWNMKVPSKAKEECIKFLNGTLEDWNRSIACVRELRNFGFSDYEIESEGSANDRWIKSALKAAN